MTYYILCTIPILTFSLGYLIGSERGWKKCARLYQEHMEGM